MFRMDVNRYGSLTASKRRYSSVHDLSSVPGIGSTELTPKATQPSTADSRSSTKQLNIRDCTKRESANRPRPLLRSSTSLILGVANERTFKRVPTIVLGRSDSLPDADDVLEKLKKTSETEQDSRDCCASESMCVVFNLDELGRSETKSKVASSGQNVENMHSKTVCTVDSDPAPPGCFTDSKSLSRVEQGSALLVPKPRAPTLGQIGHCVTAPEDHSATTEEPAVARRLRRPLKRSQSAFVMDVPKHLVHNPDDPLEAFRTRFMIAKTGQSDQEKQSTSVPHCPTPVDGNDSDASHISKERKTVANSETRRIRLLRKYPFSVDGSHVVTEAIEEKSAALEAEKVNDAEVRPHRSRRRKRSGQAKKEKTSTDDANEARRPRSVERRRRNFKFNGESHAKVMSLIEKTINQSVSRNLPNISELISSEVNRQMKELQQSGDQQPRVSSEAVYSKVYENIVSQFSKSLDVSVKSELEDTERDIARWEDRTNSSKSASLWDLSDRTSSTARQKLTPSLSFADLGLDDNFPLASSFSNPSKERRKTKSVEFLDSSDVEVEGDLNHLPLEHHIPLRTALVPLCRQVSESLQSIPCDELSSESDHKPSDVRAKARPKSLVLKLRVDLDKLEATGDGDPTMMEWDYYDHPRKDCWTADRN